MSEVPTEMVGVGRAVGPNPWRVTWVLLGVLALFVAVAFWPAVRGSFVDLDDEAYVFGNAQVLGGLTPQSIKWALTTRVGGAYMPATWLSLELDATISGFLDDDAGARREGQLPDATVYHVTNLLWQVLAVWMLFLALQRGTGNRWASFCVALLWTTHPLRVESVAWVTERKDVIAGAFGFLAIYLYVLSREKGRRRGWWMAGTAAALVMSLWGKPMFAPLPVLLVIWDYWPLGRIERLKDLRQAVIEKWPLWGIVLAGSVVAMSAAKRNGTLPIGQMEKIANALISYMRYLGMEWDFSALAAYYPYVGSPGWEAWGSLAVLVVVTGILVWKRRAFPWLLAGWLWYVVSFLPTIGIVQVSTQAYADRFSYLPSVGLFVMVVFGAFAVRRGAAWVTGGAVGLAILFAAISFHQTGYWHDSISLFEHARGVTPTNVITQAGLGNGYLRAGRWEEAERAFQAGIAAAPDEVMLHIGLIATYVNMKRFDLALPEAEKSCDRWPASSAASAMYAKALLLSGRSAEAGEQARKTLTMDPNNAEAKRILETAMGSGYVP